MRYQILIDLSALRGLKSFRRPPDPSEAQQGFSQRPIGFPPWRRAPPDGRRNRQYYTDDHRLLRLLAANTAPAEPLQEQQDTGLGAIERAQAGVVQGNRGLATENTTASKQRTLLALSHAPRNTGTVTGHRVREGWGPLLRRERAHRPEIVAVRSSGRRRLEHIGTAHEEPATFHNPGAVTEGAMLKVTRGPRNGAAGTAPDTVLTRDPDPTPAEKSSRTTPTLDSVRRMASRTRK